MKTFLGYNSDFIDKKYKNCFIDLTKPFSLKEWVNTLYYCYTNKFTCFIGNNCDISYNGIIYNNSNIVTKISWDYLIKINKIFRKRYKSQYNFTIDKSNFYIIFFIELIKYSSNNKKHIELLGNNSYFGIYDSFKQSISNNTESLYFSYGLNKFILYRVLEKNNYIIGKLIPGLKVIDKKLILDNKLSVDVPKSFLEISKNVYGIKKREITIKLRSTKPLNVNRQNLKFEKFCDNYRNENMYYFEINRHINKEILENLYKFLILRFPILENKCNNLFIEPQNISKYKSHFSMYIITNKKQYLVVHFNQILFQYIDKIVYSIDEFFDYLTKSDTITTYQYSLQYNKGDKYIHLVSEIYYLIVVIVLKIPFILKNLNFIEDDSVEYTQINYKFTKNEIDILNKKALNSYSDYLLKLVINSLSIFMENYYVFIQQKSNIDILPIYSGLDNKTIDNYLSRSRKATYSKGFLISYLSNFFINMNNKNLEIPVIFVNIMELKKSKLIKIDKIYGINKNRNIPMFFNIVYNEDELLITISYKPKYKKIKYFFNEIITQILESS